MLHDQNLLSTDRIGRLLLRLAIPAIISQVTNMLYNIVDRVFIGHIPNTGADALTGLGLCFPIIMSISAFSSLFGMGGAPKAAIEMGKNNNAQAEKILGNCFTLLLVVSLLLSGIFLLFGQDLLLLFGASNKTLPHAWDYLQIYVCGSCFVMVSLGLNPFITTQGFASTAMATVIIGAVLNIALDALFIYGFHMGIRGAAIATIISQAVSAVWVLVFLTGGKTHLKIRVKNLLPKWNIISPVMALGLSPFVMQTTDSLLNVCFNSSLKKYGGDPAVGAMTILSAVSQLCIMFLHGITQGGQPIISYNYGASKFERAKKASALQLVLCLTSSACIWLLIELFPGFFAAIFCEKKELLDLTAWALRIYAAGLIALGIQVSCQQSFVSLERAKVSLAMACLRKLVLLIPLIYILPHVVSNSLFAVFLAEPIADVLAASITVTFYIQTMKRIEEH